MKYVVELDGEEIISTPYADEAYTCAEEYAQEYEGTVIIKKLNGRKVVAKWVLGGL